MAEAFQKYIHEVANDQVCQDFPLLSCVKISNTGTVVFRCMHESIGSCIKKCANLSLVDERGMVNGYPGVSDGARTKFSMTFFF